VSNLLWNKLNFGDFEGPTGAQPSMIMMLNLANDLLYISLYSQVQDSETKSIEKAQNKIDTDKEIDL
jgi:hypothetical protein